MRILIVDDESEMADLLADGLCEEGHEAAVAHDGIQALSALAGTQPFQVAIVDVGLPGMSGFELTGHIKRHGPGVAVILLTARGAVDDRVRGLDAGADDYLVKPFAFEELSARLRAIRRRDSLTAPMRLEFGAVIMDLERHRVSAAGLPFPLTRTEFDVLRVLASTPGETVERRRLLNEVWETALHIDANVVDQYISFLRRKLADADPSVRIVTVPRVGFRLESA